MTVVAPPSLPGSSAPPASGADVEREPRVPLYVSVKMRPAVGPCWAVNLSPSGIGVVAAGGELVAWPREGARVETQFELPDGEGTLLAPAEVMWSEADHPGS